MNTYLNPPISRDTQADLDRIPDHFAALARCFDCYSAGMKANEQGVLERDCPYPENREHGVQRADWLAGWAMQQTVREKWEAICDDERIQYQKAMAA